MASRTPKEHPRFIKFCHMLGLEIEHGVQGRLAVRLGLTASSSVHPPTRTGSIPVGWINTASKLLNLPVADIERALNEVDQPLSPVLEERRRWLQRDTLWQRLSAPQQDLVLRCMDLLEQGEPKLTDHLVEQFAYLKDAMRLRQRQARGPLERLTEPSGPAKREDGIGGGTEDEVIPEREPEDLGEDGEIVR